MDFYSLSRKELQALCKKNKIPANITNVAMADALAALHQVEGLDELFDHRVEPDANQLQEDKEIGTPDINRTACRTSTRRKATRGEQESSMGCRVGNAEAIEQENENVNVPVTPAMPRSRRRAPATSTCRKTEAQMPHDDQRRATDHVPKTPAAPTTGTRAYSTRRSVRLLEKNLSKMSLMDTQDIVGLVKIDGISQDMSNISPKTEDSAETENWPSMQMVSAVFSEKTDELEVTSQEKKNEYDLGSGSEISVGASLQAEPQECSGKINSVEAEPHDSNIKLGGISEINSTEVCDESDFDLNKPTGKAVHADNKAGFLFFELGHSCDSTEPKTKKCLGTKQDEPMETSENAAAMEVTNQDVAAFSLSIGAPDGASIEVTGQDMAGSLPVTSVSDDLVSLKGSVACNSGNHHGNDSAEISSVSVNVSEDASVEAAERDVAGSLPMAYVCNDSVILKELVTFNTDNLPANDSAEISDALMSLPSCNANTLVDGDVIPEESATAKQDSSIAPVHEQKTIDIPIQSEPTDAADVTILEEDENKICTMKENTSINEYEKQSIRALKKMMRNLTVGGKSNSKSNVAKEAERKITALQALPENRMAAGETQNDG